MSKNSRKVEQALNIRSRAKRKRSNQRADQAPQIRRETEYEWINVQKILLPKSEDKLDEAIVAGIAESIRVSGQLHPIAVRRTTNKHGGRKTIERIVLVAGAHRLAAAKFLQRKRVLCVYVKGDKTDAKALLGND
jgi:ParB-like chromosome segregation protein Spo0J